MAKQIGKNASVMEPGAGPGIIPTFLDKSCTYYGFDLNSDFVNSANKKGIDIQFGNMRDEKLYRTSDTVILVDVIHHVREDDQKLLLKNTLVYARKMIIICEPFMLTKPQIFNFPIFSSIHKKLFEFMEQDGNNEARIEHVKSKDELRSAMMNGFGVIPKETRKEIKKIGDDLIVTYYLK